MKVMKVMSTWALLLGLVFVNALNVKAQTGEIKVDDLEEFMETQKNYNIAGVHVETDNRYDAAFVTTYSGLLTGTSIMLPGSELQDAMKKLWRSKSFKDIKVQVDSIYIVGSRLDVYMTIKAVTGNMLKGVQILGLSKKRRKKLEEYLELKVDRDRLTDYYLQNVYERTKRYYIEDGYANVEVAIKEIEVKPGELKSFSLTSQQGSDLSITVNRGKKIKVEEIRFVGVTKEEGKWLKKSLESTKEYRWWNPFRNSKFKKDEYEDDKANILSRFRNGGYKDAKVLSDSIWKSSENRVTIELRVEQGKRYYVRNITWTGNTEYKSEELDRYLGIPKGSVYNQGLLNRNLTMNITETDISSLYLNKGYLFFRVDPVETKIEGDSVDLQIRISEGQVTRVRNVIITGNTYTHDKVLLREIRTKPGQKFSRSDIVRSQRELMQLNLFEPSGMNVIPRPDQKEGVVDIEYVVEEKPSDRIELSGGYGAGQLVGVLGVTFTNFSMDKLMQRDWSSGYPRGDAQTLSVRAQSNGRQFQSYNLSFSDPWFGGKKPRSFSAGLFFSIQRYGNIFSVTERQELRAPGMSIGLGTRLKKPDDWFILNNTLNYQHYRFSNLSLIPNLKNGYSNNLSFKHILARNSVDQPIYATSGSIVSTTLQWTPPYSLFAKEKYANLGTSEADYQKKYSLLEYYKLKFDLQHYVPLSRGTRSNPSQRLVLLTEAHFGLIGKYNADVGLTPFERFYLGGDGLTGFVLDGRELIRLRGYNSADAVTPRIRDKNGNPLEEGGTLYNKFTAELRYPITTSQAATIYMLAFAEGGNAWQRFENMNPFQLKRSAGVGVRIFLPMFGLLGFDWGYGFDPALGGTPGVPSGGNFHFYIGQPLF